MEVYQSSKTAAEMEFALGAIPSIGANNHWFIGDVDTGVLAEGLTPYVGENQNWWVGETDTGVFACGVKIEGTAEVGQTIVVKAVDENGKPTEWVCGGELRCIKEIILTEDTYTIDINSDSEGKPFELTELIIYGFTQGTASAGQFRINCFADNDNKYSLVAIQSFKGLDTSKRYWMVKCEYLGYPGKWMRGYSTPDTNATEMPYLQNGCEARTHNQGIVDGLGGLLTKLSHIRITSNTSGNNLAAGSMIRIYGR